MTSGRETIPELTMEEFMARIPRNLERLRRFRENPQEWVQEMDRFSEQWRRENPPPPCVIPFQSE